MKNRVLTIGIAVVVLVASICLWIACGRNPDVFQEQRSGETPGKSAGTRGRVDLTFHQPSMDGMEEIQQPKEYSNDTLRESPDGRYAAFVARNKSGCKIVMLDRKTGVESALPAPKERLLRVRDIKALQWDANGVLYVVENAIDNKLSLDDCAKLSPREQVARIRPVLYSWSVGATEVASIDQVQGRYLGLTVGRDSSVRFSHESQEKGWGFVDVRTYRDGKLKSAKSFEAILNGKPTDVFSAQVPSGRNEFWFVTNEFERNKVNRLWLALIDLDKPEAGARLIEPDVCKDFTLSSDEKKITLLKATFTRDTGTYNFYTLQTEAKGNPTPLFLKKFYYGKNVFTPEFVGASFDGKKLYFRGLGKQHVELLEFDAPGNVRIYAVDVP